MQLTQQVFYILLSLAIKDRHGYDIMKEVEKLSNSYVTMGPGTLYGAIKRMLGDGLICIAHDTAEGSRESRVYSQKEESRKYYAITDKGKDALHIELNKFSFALDIAKKAHIVGFQFI